MNEVQCPICKESLKVSLAASRRAKKKKAFIMLVCPNDGRHFRGFISDQEYVANIVESQETGMKVVSTGRGEGRGTAADGS